MFEGFMADVDAHLAGRATMEGDGLTFADFCVYHPIWLSRSVGGARSLSQRAELSRWFEHMEGLGHGQREELSADEAFGAAADAEPRGLPDDAGDHEHLGAQVSVAPGDYGKVST